ISTIENEIDTLFKRLELVPIGKPKLVAFSMTMHCFLPNLLMPINRTHTLKFFYGNTYLPADDEEQIKIYKNIFEEIREFSTTLTPKEDYLKPNGWSRNVPKLIDGIIISSVKQGKDHR
ncbi:MAG: hypothetical protein LBQ65_09185, partial [Tannerellaceae bacterium]|nr:hypothetical protein [Tannerellaceae bacterium]